MTLEYQQCGVQFNVSQHSMRRWKTYKRNGKTFLRDYKREVKGGMNIVDLQRMLNSQLSASIIDGLSINVYTQQSILGTLWKKKSGS